MNDGGGRSCWGCVPDMERTALTLTLAVPSSVRGEDRVLAVRLVTLGMSKSDFAGPVQPASVSGLLLTV